MEQPVTLMQAIVNYLHLSAAKMITLTTRYFAPLKPCNILKDFFCNYCVAGRALRACNVISEGGFRDM